MRSRSLLIVLLALAACTEPVVPVDRTILPPGAEQFTPPWWYADSWARMEACSGYKRDMAQVRFYHVRGADTVVVPQTGNAAVAYYNRAISSIVFAGRWASFDMVVEHEMLHALLPKGGHPEEFDRCGVRLGSPHD